MFGGKKAKELEEELLALQEKQNRLQERISNITKAKDSAEETVVQMTISKTELDETIAAVSEELELLKALEMVPELYTSLWKVPSEMVPSL